MAVDLRIHCVWCNKPNRRPSDWEQDQLRNRGYAPLCVRCANQRLDNPWNALLPMRKIQPSDHTTTGQGGAG